MNVLICTSFFCAAVSGIISGARASTIQQALRRSACAISTSVSGMFAGALLAEHIVAGAAAGRTAQISNAELHALYVFSGGLIGIIMGLTIVSWLWNLIFGERPPGGFQRLISLIAILTLPFISVQEMKSAFLGVMLLILIILLRWLLVATYRFVSKLLLFRASWDEKSQREMFIIFFVATFFFAPLLFHQMHQFFSNFKFNNPFLSPNLLAGFASCILSALFVRLCGRIAAKIIERFE